MARFDYDEEVSSKFEKKKKKNDDKKNREKQLKEARRNKEFKKYCS